VGIGENSIIWVWNTTPVFFPVVTPLYGIHGSPRFPYRIVSENGGAAKGLMEIPLSTYRMPFLGKRIPIAGGFYLRFFPYLFIRHRPEASQQRGQCSGLLHPSVGTGSRKTTSPGLKWYHYYRIASTEAKFPPITGGLPLHINGGLD